MGYIGNQTSNSYTSLDKQTITGDGGASYTLDHAVANENEIEVFVNNVRQEPSVAYTVSGTALTMTGNVESSDDFYVVFQGKAIQTTSHPEGQDLQARDGTFTGDLTVDTNTLYVDSTNDRVGIGNTNPRTPIEIRSANTLGSTFTGSTNGEGLRVTQTNYTAGNFVSLIEAPYDDANSSANVRIGAMFNSSGSNLSFGTSNSYGSGITNEAMRIESDGAISKNGSFSTSNTSDDFYWNTGTAARFRFHSGITGSRNLLGFSNPNGQVGAIETNGSATTYATSSDYRLKENAVDMTGAITRVKNLQPKRFNFISDTTDTLVDGFMAHEAQTVVPEAVTGTHNEVDADGNAVYQGIDQAKLVPLLTGALQEAIAKIEALETRVQALEDA